MIITIRSAAIAAIAAALIGGCGVASSPEALLDSAKNYLAKNDKKAAIIQLKNALQSNPNLAEARFLLGMALLETGDPTSAEKELRKALQLNYPADQVIPPLARSLLLLGENKKLIDEFGKADVAGPEARAKLQTAIGEAYLALRNVDAARAAFTSALAAQPQHAPAQIGQAKAAAIQGNLSNALAIIDSALAISPNTPEAWHLKGDMHAARGDAAAALAAYRKLVEVKPDFLPGHAALLETLLRDAKIAEATKQLEAMKQIAPKHALTLYFQALLAYGQKNYTVAQQASQQQLRVVPDSMPGLVLAAAIDFELKAYAQAEAKLLKVLQRNPNAQQARRMLITAYVRRGQATKALEALNPVLGKIGKNAAWLALAGEVYMINGESSKAAEYFAKATALDPGNAKTRTSLALTHMVIGDTEKGFNELEQTASMDSGIRANLALVATHMQRREYDKALAAITDLEKKQPESPVPHSLRAAALIGKNDTAGARRSWERALELNPAYFPAAVNLARLDAAEKKPEKARQRFRAVLEKDPKHLQALLALAELDAAGGAKPEDVAASISKAITAHPTEVQPRVALTNYYLRVKDTKKAVIAAQQALATIPERPEILDLAGRAYQAAGETNQALSIYTKLASAQPGSPQPYMRMAEVQLAAKDTSGAMQNLRKALEIKPDLLEVQHAIIVLHTAAGRPQDAIALAREVQKQRPGQPVGYVLEGEIYAANKKWAEAATAYERGLKQAASTELAVKLHSVLTVGGSRARADQFAANWLKDHSNDEAFRLYLAQIANSRKDYATAALHYRKLLDAQPNNAIVLNNLAWTTAQLQDPQAIGLAEKAHKLAPDHPAIMDTLGTLLIEKGESARGLELLRKASALAPKSPDIRLNLAKGLIKVGQKDAARKELDELAKLGDKYSAHAEVTKLRQGL